MNSYRDVFRGRDLERLRKYSLEQSYKNAQWLGRKFKSPPVIEKEWEKDGMWYLVMTGEFEE